MPAIHGVTGISIHDIPNSILNTIKNDMKIKFCIYGKQMEKVKSAPQKGYPSP